MRKLKGIIVVVCVLFLSVFWHTPSKCEAFNMTVLDKKGVDEMFALQALSFSPVKNQSNAIYIYHTHTYEAYTKGKKDTYQETQKWRTENEDYNVVQVGETLALLLHQRGFTVFHDKTAYEPPNLESSYARSLEGVKKNMQEGILYDLYIDIHRDAYCLNNGPNVVDVEGKESARLLFLVGKGTGTQFDELPDYPKNKQMAEDISAIVNQKYPRLFRNTKSMIGRYNQHIAPCCLLLEVGNNKNTLKEALHALPPLADGISAYFDTKKP